MKAKLMSRPGIVFGALAPKLHKQLNVPERSLRYFQQCADGIVALAIGGLLSRAEVHRARQRLVKRLARTFPQARPRK